jgi:hypothetical protein
MGQDGPSNQIQLPCHESVVARNSKRIKPEFASLVIALHMNVWWLITIKAREEKPV